MVSKAESDPHGKKPFELGAKLDSGKTPVYRGFISYFPRAMDAVASISAFGANKYAWNGWQSVPDGVNRYSDAMVRHMLYRGKGEILDPDSGFPHRWHEVWNALAALERELMDAET